MKSIILEMNKNIFLNIKSDKIQISHENEGHTVLGK